jgi:hypothetical protein
MLVFAIRLIFPSSQIVANTSVCNQAHIPLLSARCMYQCFISDTRKYHCSHSASYSSPLRSSHVPVFALSHKFPSSQILANTTVLAQPHIPLLTDPRKNKCSRSASYSSSQILAHTIVHTQPHSPLISDTRNYDCLHSALYSLHFRYLQLSVIALHQIIPFSLIIANTNVSGQPQILLLSGTRTYQCSRSASYWPPLKYSQIPVFALSLILLSSQILATTNVRPQHHIPLPSNTRKYQCLRLASYFSSQIFTTTKMFSCDVCIYMLLFRVSRWNNCSWLLLFLLL